MKSCVNCELVLNRSILVSLEFCLSEQLIYLRRFPKLLTLNLGGNPICEQDDYKKYVVAHLPNLEYLDYRLVDEASVSTQTLSPLPSFSWYICL